MNDYQEYLNQLGLDELKDIYFHIDREKYKDRFELVKKEISDRKKGKNNTRFITKDKIEVTSNKQISLIVIFLGMILLLCGAYIIHIHGVTGLIPGIFFILLSFFFGVFGFKDLFELPVIGKFDSQGYEDYRIGIKLPYNDFELVIRPSPRITVIGIKIHDFTKYELSINKSHREKCRKRDRTGKGHMFFTNYNVNMSELLNYIDKAG